MKIDNNSLQTTNTQSREVTSRSSDVARTNSGSTGSASERVSLSGDARLLNELQATVRQQAEVDQDRVAGIKARIEAGTYHVDPEKLANSFLELESILDQ